MTLNYTSLQALINKRYMPVLYDLIFKKVHYLTSMLKRKAKTFNDRKIVVPLEYGTSSNVQYTDPYEILDLAPVDPFTAAEWMPRMLAGTLTISKEEELVMNSEMAVKNILDSKMKNLKKSIEKTFSEQVWKSYLSGSWVAKEWNCLDMLVWNGFDNAGTYLESCGSIPATGVVPTWWRSHVIDAENDAAIGNGTALTEAHMKDATAKTYIMRIIQRGIAAAKRQTGENPDLILCPQFIWDVLESILDPQKRGSKLTASIASMGFSAIDYRNIPIIADDDMTKEQGGWTTVTTRNPDDSADKGRIYFLNLDYLYMFFNSAAKFTAGKFIEPANQLSKSCKVIAYGNMIITNRGAQAVVTNVYSPQEYIGL